MEKLKNMWEEKRYHSIVEECEDRLVQTPDDGVLRCFYAKALINTGSLLEPKIETATNEFVDGYEKIDDRSARYAALTEFLEAMKQEKAGLDKFLPTSCIFETSLNDYRKCMLDLTSTVATLMARIYKNQIPENPDAAKTYIRLLEFGADAARECCMTRGVKRLTDKKTFVAVSMVRPQSREELSRRFDRFVALIRETDSNYEPSPDIERTVPDETARLVIVNDFLKMLGDDPNIRGQKTKDPERKKGGLLSRLFG